MDHAISTTHFHTSTDLQHVMTSASKPDHPCCLNPQALNSTHPETTTTLSHLQTRIAVLELKLKHAENENIKAQAAINFLLDSLVCKVNTSSSTGNKDATSSINRQQLARSEEEHQKLRLDSKLLKAENTRLRTQCKRLKSQRIQMHKANNATTDKATATFSSTDPTATPPEIESVEDEYDLLDLNSFDITVGQSASMSTVSSQEGNYQSRAIGKLIDEFPVPPPRPVRLFVKKNVPVVEEEGKKVDNSVVVGETSRPNGNRFSLSGVPVSGAEVVSSSKTVTIPHGEPAIASVPKPELVRHMPYPQGLEHREKDNDAFCAPQKHSGNTPPKHEVKPKPTANTTSITISLMATPTTASVPIGPRATQSLTRSSPATQHPPHRISSTHTHCKIPNPHHPRNHYTPYPPRPPRLQYRDLDYEGGTAGPKTYGIPHQALLRYDDLDEDAGHVAAPSSVPSVAATRGAVWAGGLEAKIAEARDVRGVEEKKSAGAGVKEVEMSQVTEQADAETDLLTFPPSPTPPSTATAITTTAPHCPTQHLLNPTEYTENTSNPNNPTSDPAPKPPTKPPQTHPLQPSLDAALRAASAFAEWNAQADGRLVMGALVDGTTEGGVSEGMAGVVGERRGEKAGEDGEERGGVMGSDANNDTNTTVESASSTSGSGLGEGAGNNAIDDDVKAKDEGEVAHAVSHLHALAPDGVDQLAKHGGAGQGGDVVDGDGAQVAARDVEGEGQVEEEL